jgi:hypothetical protein
VHQNHRTIKDYGKIVYKNIVLVSFTTGTVILAFIPKNQSDQATRFIKLSPQTLQYFLRAQSYEFSLTS